MFKQLSCAISCLVLLGTPAEAQTPPQSPVCACLYADFVPKTASPSTLFFGLSYSNHTDVGFSSVEVRFIESDGTVWTVGMDPLAVRQKHTYTLFYDNNDEVLLHSADDPTDMRAPFSH